MSKRRNHRRGMGFDTSLLLKIGAGVLVFAGILGALLGTGYASTNLECQSAGYGGAANMDTCRIDEKYAYDRIAVVVGDTANTPAPRLSDELVKYLKNSLLKNPDLKVDIISATPSRNTKQYAPVQIKQTGNNQELLDGIEQAVANIDAALRESTAVENGAEYLEAIRRAASIVSGGKGCILVIGSGLSDSAPLNFADTDLLSRSTNEVVKVYKAAYNNNLPYYGIDLVWYGLGSIVAPQSRLSAADIEVLENHYSTLLQEMGIRVTIDNSSFDGDSLDTKYTVKTTRPTSTTMIFEQNFNDADLGFAKDATTFRDGETAAWAAIERSGILSQIASNTHLTIYIDGYVAVACGETADIKLAQGRADAVKQLFIKRGIKNNIVATGKGQTEEAKRDSICIGKSTDAELERQRVVIIYGKE